MANSPPDHFLTQKTSQLRMLARAISHTQDFCKGGFEGQSLRGPEFSARVSSHYGVYLEFYPDDVILGARLDKVDSRLGKHDFRHRGKNEAARCLRNSYSVITDLSTFLHHLRRSTLRGETIQAECVRDTLLSLMGHRPDIHSGRISPKLPDDSEERMSSPLMN